MPKSEEHKSKYVENKYIIDSVLDDKEQKHNNWISTICFYAAMHIVEMELAQDGIHSKDHFDRELNMQRSKRISQYILMRYKQMYTTSILARYEAGIVPQTVTHQMKTYLSQIEKELGLNA